VGNGNLPKGWEAATRFLAALDTPNSGADNGKMKTAKKSPIPPEIMAELQKAADKAAKGIRDPEEMRKASEEMDRIREEIYNKHGILDIGVPAIRELREGE
jgi:hypothetical protein